MASLTIWCNARLTEQAMADLRSGVAPHRFILAQRVVNNVEPSEPDASLPEADVAFGQPDPRQMMESDRLKWVQLSSAGYARYDRQDLRDALSRRGAILCNSSSVYSDACAQHALSFILAGARQLPAASTNQQTARAWPSAQLRGASHLLGGQKILILSFGSIARRLVELLTPLKMEMMAVRRRVGGNEPVPVRPATELDSLLGWADHIVNILPASNGTDRLFNAQRFGLMKPGAIFYNIGRGATVDQAALRDSLSCGHLSAAYLDVTHPEPLPPDDPLWRTPNCFITPHTAGGAADEFDRVVRHFLENLARFTGGQELRDRIV
jgi:phosphoglycerate dehydrogenase-like enzyme